MRYDVVIVGAGSAGATLAARLSEDSSRSVLLVEAGPDYPALDELPDELKYGYGTGHALVVSPEHNWEFSAEGTAWGPQVDLPSGRVTGGTSAINGQIFLRGTPEDFDSWAARGNDRWSFREVLPFFRKLESDADFDGGVHGTDGPIPVYRFPRDEWLPVPLAFRQACLALGFPECLDANGLDSGGVAACPFNNPGRIRMSTALTYLPQARPRPNFTLLANTLARRLLFDGTRAVGVELEHEGRVTTAEGNEIVVSAGGIGSPALLLRSGVGDPTHLREVGVPIVRGLPGVGHNLQEHPIVGTRWRTQPAFAVDEHAPHSQCFLRYTASTSQIRTDMFVRELHVADELALYAGTYSPLSRGNIRLASRDPSDKPLINYRFLENEFDRERVREGVRLCVTIGEHEAFAEVIESRLSPTDADIADDTALDAWLDQAVESGRHVTSACKMGPASDPASVVDQYGRVHGVDGLRVVDASIMPSIVRANTNATTIMIAERIAALMSEES